MSSPALASTAGHLTGRALPPLTYTLPSWEPDLRPRRRSVLQLPVGLGMYALAIWLSTEDATFRHVEAWLATPVTGFVTGRHGATTSHDLVYFALGTPRAFGLHITQECTSALLLIPLLVMMGSFTIFSRLSLWRELAAVAVGALLLLVVNIARLAGIAWATWRFGYSPGYTISHVFVGSALSLIGFVGAMLLALWILVRGTRTARTPSAATVAEDTGRITLARCQAALEALSSKVDDFELALQRASSSRRPERAATPPVDRPAPRRRPRPSPAPRTTVGAEGGRAAAMRTGSRP